MKLRILSLIILLFILTGCTRDEIMNWAKETQEFRNNLFNDNSTFTSPIQMIDEGGLNPYNY